MDFIPKIMRDPTFLWQLTISLTQPDAIDYPLVNNTISFEYKVLKDDYLSNFFKEKRFFVQNIA
tara:strand:- start:58 stop:249 length:192 start_codon:yes stop_codon:yes gene_type:complete